MITETEYLKNQWPNDVKITDFNKKEFFQAVEDEEYFSIYKKYDGIFCNIRIVVDNIGYVRSVTSFSKSGKILQSTKLIEEKLCDLVSEAIKKNRITTNEIVFNIQGELISKTQPNNFKLSSGIARRQSPQEDLQFIIFNCPAIINDELANTLYLPSNHTDITYYGSTLDEAFGLWYSTADLLNIGKGDPLNGLLKSCNKMAGDLQRLPASKSIKYANGRHVINEGFVIRTNSGKFAWKLKYKQSGTFMVKGYNIGLGRLVKSVGSIVVYDKYDNEVVVGSGLDDKARDRIKNMEKIIMVEIEAKAFDSENKSLREPVFKGFRFDKSPKDCEAFEDMNKFLAVK